MSKSLTQLLFFVVVTSLLCACSGYERALRSKDVNYKLTKANQFYDKKKYQQANSIFETLVPVFKSTRNYEPLYYRYAYSFYYMNDYLSASYHFRNFVEAFPNSKDADEIEYMYCLCLFKMSPVPSLDPTNTERAMEAFQDYINRRPESKRLEEVNKYIDICRGKLEEKDADAAKLYYNIGYYKSAGVCYKQVMRNYPESGKSDFYQYMIVKSLYKYAKESIKEKQEERFAGALNAYTELIEGYPKSSYIRDAEKYYTLATNSIKKIRDEHK
jgi:outer membrane protein assembly factor BamD